MKAKHLSGSPSLYNLDEYEKLSGRPFGGFREAPLSGERVRRGELPPLEARLPDNPLVMEAWDETGVYGGTVRYSEINTKFCHYLRHMLEAELLELGPSGRYHHYSRMEGPVRPGIFEHWACSDDGKAHTFRIRKGLKWSDGVPVTTEDVRYAYEDVVMHPEIRPLLTNSEGSVIFLPEWEWIAWGGTRTKLEIVDGREFRLVFGKSYPGFITQQIRSARWHMLLRPAHYLKAFHSSYRPPEELSQVMREKGFGPGQWGPFYQSIDPPVREAGYMIPAGIPDIERYPSLDPWLYEPGYTAAEAALVRNPYYYKVDQAGNQLPYIDRIERSAAADLNGLRERIRAGLIDIQTNFLKLKELSPLLEASKAGDCSVMLLPAWQGQQLAVTLNFCPEDDAIGEIVRDLQFRRALSLGIDRERIRREIFLGFGRTAQATAPSYLDYFRGEFESSCAAFEPEEANRLLDAMGLHRRDAEGWRLRPDGRRLELLMAYFHVTPPAADGAEAIAGDWAKLGLCVQVQALPTGREWGELQVTNRIIFSIWEMVGGDPLIPYHEGGLSDSTPLWWKWYETGGREGVEPLPAAKRLYECREVIKTSSDPAERTRMAEEIYRIQAEQLWLIGTVAGTPQPFVYNRRLGNVNSAAERGYFTSTVLGAAEQWYFKAE
ncbi:hypothetical protein KP806_12690 [Paenibacillus sp. N4]|uniref:ABC transporter substrate-binding protein n=1 Tax=Paenibacillus vietnamensis TaxID=2590547 RepID=UPI001CD0586C|nr:ABC transporter substrate-binding protein [Paenibacillus vietnamensis]MCA0755907.1 hypothetical protein [Paenibacillus vietnamensis]